MRIPLHSKTEDMTPEKQIHRQLMVNATGGKGFHPKFMERTVRAAGDVPAHFFDKEKSARQVRKAEARALYLARAAASSSAAATGPRQTRKFHEQLSLIVA